MRKLLAVCFLAITNTAWAGNIDTEIDKLLEEYFKIQTVLAEDSKEGVDAAAAQIVELLAQGNPSIDPLDLLRIRHADVGNTEIGLIRITNDRERTVCVAKVSRTAVIRRWIHSHVTRQWL